MLAQILIKTTTKHLQMEILAHYLHIHMCLHYQQHSLEVDRVYTARKPAFCATESDTKMTKRLEPVDVRGGGTVMPQ